jgi:hypothetical protein
MNTTIEKIFEEIGRLHVQIQQQAAYIAQLEATVKQLQAEANAQSAASAKPAVPAATA